MPKAVYMYGSYKLHSVKLIIEFQYFKKIN